MRRRRRRGLLADVSPAFRAEAIAARGAAAGPAVMPLAFREGWIELLYFGQVLGLSGVPGLVDTRRHTRKACKQRRVYEPTRGTWACSGKTCLQSRFDRACAWSSMLIPKP